MIIKPRLTFPSVPAHSVGENPKDLPNVGSVLQPYGGRGDASGTPFRLGKYYFCWLCVVTLNEDATLRGVVIYYPEQLPTSTPVPYPWTIDMLNENAAVIDVECLNCWNAIRAVQCARHYIARVQGIESIDNRLFTYFENSTISPLKFIHFIRYICPNFLSGQPINTGIYIDET